MMLMQIYQIKFGFLYKIKMAALNFTTKYFNQDYVLKALFLSAYNQ